MVYVFVCVYRNLCIACVVFKHHLHIWFMHEAGCGVVNALLFMACDVCIYRRVCIDYLCTIVNLHLVVHFVKIKCLTIAYPYSGTDNPGPAFILSASSLELHVFRANEGFLHFLPQKTPHDL